MHNLARTNVIERHQAQCSRPHLNPDEGRPSCDRLASSAVGISTDVLCDRTVKQVDEQQLSLAGMPGFASASNSTKPTRRIWVARSALYVSRMAGRRHGSDRCGGGRLVFFFAAHLW